MKENKYAKDKERILLNTFEALRKLGEKSSPVASKSKDVIDISGEEENSRTYSEIYQCEQYDYQFLLISSFRTHWHRKHGQLKCVCHHCGKPFIVNSKIYMNGSANFFILLFRLVVQ